MGLGFLILLSAFDMYNLPELSIRPGLKWQLCGYTFYKYVLWPFGEQYRLPYHATSYYEGNTLYSRRNFYLGAKLKMYNFSYSYPYLMTAFVKPEVRIGYDGSDMKIRVGELGSITLGNGLLYKDYYGEGVKFSKKLSKFVFNYTMLGSGLTVADDVYYISFGVPPFYVDVLYNNITLQKEYAAEDIFFSINGAIYDFYTGLSYEYQDSKWAMYIKRYFLLENHRHFLRFRLAAAYIQQGYYTLFQRTISTPAFYNNIDTNMYYNFYFYPDSLWRPLDNPVGYIGANDRDLWITSAHLSYIYYFQKSAPFMNIQFQSINNELNFVYEAGIKVPLVRFLSLYIFVSNKATNIFDINYDKIYKNHLHYIAFVLKYMVADERKNN